MPAGRRIVYFRSDSAGYQAKVINFCFERDILFTITADQDKAVKEVIRSIGEERWQPYENGREIAEAVHIMNHTERAFRLIVQRWPKLQGELFDPNPYCYHVIATNRDESPQEIVALHNQRGQAENYIKELVNGFGMEWMPCGRSFTNAVFFRIGVLAYNLFLAMKLLALPPWYRSFTISTVRWKLYQVAGVVVRHAHQVYLKLATHLKRLILFHKFRLRCFEVACG